MKKIVLLSDTHSTLDEFILKHVRNCDEIWHAGDIGSEEVYHTLSSIKPLKAVYGNIDNTQIRLLCPEIAVFESEGVKVYMRHIAGSPPRYHHIQKQELLEIKAEQPKLFICGHSHILKVQYDTKNDWLFMNPGAAGNHGFHNKRTLLRFMISQGDITNLELIEKDR